MKIEVIKESKEKMKRSLSVFKRYALLKGVKELDYLNDEEGTGFSKANMFYFQTNDIEALITSFKKDKKKDIERNSKNLPGNKFRAWDDYGTVKIASLEADDYFTNYLKNQKPTGISTFEPSEKFSF